MANKNYINWTKEELVTEIASLKKRKKYGLNWEEKREDVVERCKEDTPVLTEVKNLEIISNIKDPMNLIIEGDNYHSLSILNYTHKGKVNLIYIDPPYNTGAKNWTYNNDFVDEEDSFRHSKWLSMMKSRLELSKTLLSKKGVLICTIDKHEQARLALLLEEIFTNYEVVCVTIVHNPAGTQGNNFSHSNEYAYFVFPKGGVYINKTERKNPLESAFRDWGNISLRTQAKNCFYPIIVKDSIIIDFGEVCANNFHPKSPNIKQKDGSVWVYPIKDNQERKWVFSRASVEKIKNELFCKFRSDEITIHRKKYETSYKTVWDDKRYYANIHGSSLLNSIIQNDFPFPKSIHATLDCIKAVIHDKKDSIILDFFAGSGTTGHAVMQLNKEDGGKRQFILCTNNENKIAQDVTYPRIKKVIKGYKNIKNGKKIKGLGGNLKYYKTAFVPAGDTDQHKTVLKEKITEMICIKEEAFIKVKSTKKYKIFKGNSKHVAIIYDLLSIETVKKEITKTKTDFNVYIFSLGDDSFEDEFEGMEKRIKVIPIPGPVLETYENILKS